jgi:hypothetical protein
MHEGEFFALTYGTWEFCGTVRLVRGLASEAWNKQILHRIIEN